MVDGKMEVDGDALYKLLEIVDAAEIVIETAKFEEMPWRSAKLDKALKKYYKVCNDV